MIPEGPSLNETMHRLNAALGGRYRIERELGAGGMATVWLARDLKHNRDVALKVLKPELAHALGADRFLREIETTANLRHPHILPLFDSGQVDDLLYYVMPYIDGETLRDRLQRETRLPLPNALRIASEVADALSHAHSRGIVHRDIKPANILLESGHAVVADFGIAHAVDAAGGAQLTETGLSVGTPTYMSPEQAATDAEPDARTDQYALGCVLFEMLTGQPPFAGATAGAVIRQHIAVEPPPVTALRPEVPDDVATVIRKTLSKDPVDRFDDIAQLRDALRASLSPAMSATSAPHRKQTRGRLLGITAGLVGIAAMVAVTLLGGDRTALVTPEASVAVLPFLDLSRDQADAYLGEGIAETLTNALANVPGLNVAARASAFSFRERDEDVREIGRELGVATVLDGSVQRAGESLRVTAQLVRTSDGLNVWSNNFDRDAGDIFALQDEVAAAVAEALRGELLGGQPRTGTGTRDLQAYDAYLQGRFFWKKRAVPDLLRAIEYFDEAIARDSTYAEAWAGLADAWLVLPFYSDTILSSETIPRARRAAEHALSLDPDLAEAHASLAYALTVFDWDWERAGREFLRALELDPGYPTAHKWYSDLLRSVGRFDEALLEAERAAELDPRSPNARTIVAIRKWGLGREDEARVDLERALEMDPTFPLTLRHAEKFYWSIGDTARFFALRERLDAVSGNTNVPVSALRAAIAAGGPDSVLRLQTRSPEARWTPADRARWHTMLGDFDAAFADLEQAIRERTVWLSFAINHPDMAPLRSDPRFAAVLTRMDLEQPASTGGGRQ